MAELDSTDCQMHRCCTGPIDHLLECGRSIMSLPVYHWGGDYILHEPHGRLVGTANFRWTEYRHRQTKRPQGRHR
jgi:hypothetical protein